MADIPATPTAGWDDVAQGDWYVNRIGKLEARQAGERMVIDALPPDPRRVLALGCGDGRLAALVLPHRPSVEEVVAVDSSPPILDRASERSAGEARVHVRAWDLRSPLTELGRFD